MISRRRLLLTGAAGVAIPQRALAQTAGRHYRIGWISSSDSFKEPYALAFVQRLAELGLVEGRNLAIERRHADGKLEKMPALSAAMAKIKCDAYFGGGGEANLAALTQAGRDTPIVFVAVDFDPVVTGDVASLARPGGRVTGVTALQSALPAKRLELLKELFPGMGKVAVFTNDQTTAQLALVQGTARRIGLALHVVDFRRPPFDYQAGFSEAARAKVDALFVVGSGLWVPARHLIPELALKARLPTVFHQAQWVDAGGLMSYGFDFTKMWRRGAELMTSVLRGAKPANIPMEQPTDYELVINKKTAQALGLKIPQSVLLRADRVIE
jgi:putative ABC transport system substrate-binding protein